LERSLAGRTFSIASSARLLCALTFTGTINGLPEEVPGIDVKQRISAVKFGINYLFNWGKAPTPVVARY